MIHKEPLDIFRLIECQAESTPDNLALLAPDRSPLTYQGLYAHLSAMRGALRARGIGPCDPVALVLQTAPEMGVAFLTIASHAIAAPLNANYSSDEFDFYLTDLAARAVIVQAGSDSPVREVARAQSIPLIELSPALDARAGLFTLAGGDGMPVAEGCRAQPGDRALILHTSGTTSRPKQVPLTHANLCSSAYQIRASLQLTSADRCLNIMPLFHIHGLLAGVLATLAAGASVVCPPGFRAPEFFAWLETFRPTWYSAVPTMHQAILARAALTQTKVVDCPLRFIRSCSSALPPQLLSELETTFGVTVIEAYGMTEAAHQIACNPLPPGQRKPGTVGVATGTEIAIMDEQGRNVALGESGEIVIRGANIMHGYAHNPEANARAFTDGWFRTGDQGYLDADGYLAITARLKEIINRGGEKIAPREVDEVLLRHPAVAQAVAFAVPDATLGEEVAAAVVLKEELPLPERELQEFASLHLAAFKVPRSIVILQDIPRGPTGKIQRSNLAKALGPLLLPALKNRPRAAFVEPRTPTEKALAKIWSQVLDLEQIGVHDEFLALGGDSLLAGQIASTMREVLHKDVSLLAFFRAATLHELARYVDGL